MKDYSTSIQEERNERAYFTIIPNIVFEIGLSAYAIALYAHIKRVAGENGKCWQSLATIGEHLGISRPTVLKARKELEKAGLIRVESPKDQAGGYGTCVITVVDIWLKNAEKFAKQPTQSTTFTTQSTTFTGGVNDVDSKNITEEERINNNCAQNFARACPDNRPKVCWPEDRANDYIEAHYRQVICVKEGLRDRTNNFLTYLKDHNPELVELAEAFINAKQIAPIREDYRKWVKALRLLHEKKVDAEILGSALAYAEKIGIVITSPFSLRNLIDRALAQRIPQTY